MKDQGRGRGDQGRGRGDQERGRGDQERGRGIRDHATHQYVIYDKHQTTKQPYQGTDHPPSVVPPDSNTDPSQSPGSHNDNSSIYSYKDQTSFNSSLQHQFETHLSFDQILTNHEKEYQSLQSKLEELERKPSNEFFIGDHIRLHATLHSMEEKSQNIIPYYQRELTRIEEEDLKPIAREIEGTQYKISVSIHRIKRLSSNGSSTLYGALDQDLADERVRLAVLQKQLQKQEHTMEKKQEQLRPTIATHKATMAQLESEKQEVSEKLKRINNPISQRLREYAWEPNPPPSLNNHPLDNTISSEGMNCMIESILRAYGQYNAETLPDMSRNIRNYLIQNNLAAENELLNQVQGQHIMHLLRWQGFTDGRAVRIHQFTNQRSNNTVDPYLTEYEFVPAAPGSGHLPPIRIFFNNLAQHFSAILPQEHIPSEATQLNTGSTQKRKRASTNKNAKVSEALAKAKRIENREKRKAAGEIVESDEEELNTDEEHRIQSRRKANANSDAKVSEALAKAKRIENREKRKAAGETVESDEEELNTDEERRVQARRKAGANRKKRTRFSNPHSAV